MMLKEGIHGFSMALADSVPGVSGGTVAFILGFYDRFIGFIAGAIPLIVREEKESFASWQKGMPFCIGGIVVVAGITLLNGFVGAGSMDLSRFSIGLGIRLFFIGMVAISAMFLPGISGSTLLFERIWGDDSVGDSATVMVHINRIREKIEDDSKNPKILETIWGVGYRLNK